MADSKIRVLLVDDEPSIVKILGRLLQLSGFEVTTALDGEEGLAKVRSEHPDVVILDLMLPKMNGFDVCVAIKGSEETKKTRVLIFTARGRQEEKHCLELGADAFFNKLDPAASIIDKIKTLTSNKPVV